MNYIKQLNELYTTLDYKPLTAEAISVYFVLLQIANKTGWIDEFRVANIVLIGKCNISIDELKTARNKLKTLGYIDYTKGKNQNEAPKYKIIQLYVSQAETQALSQPPTQAPTQTLPHINKQNKTKKEKYKKEIELFVNENFENEELKNTIYEFIKMRKEIKKPISLKGLQILVNKLNKLASTDEEKIEILNNSIMNNWQGIFELKKEKSNLEVKAIKEGNCVQIL